MQRNPLALHSFCLLLDPKTSSEVAMFDKLQTKWLQLYRVEKILINNNYIVRKVGTNSTQCVHRIRLRPIEPKFAVNDLSLIDPAAFTTDDFIREEFQIELALLQF